MTDGVSFERLCSLFARGLLDQAHAYESGQLSKFQRSRLGEAMTAEIRKLGDMAIPAARPPKISVAAKTLADSFGHDLTQQTWHSQKRLDSYKTYTYEHFFTVRDIRLEIAKQSTTSEVIDVLNRMLWIAWITKREDARLRALGFGSVRPDPVLAYRTAEIELLPEYPPIVRAAAAPPSCSSCGASGSWLVTGGAQSNAPGRVLVYCDPCRLDRAEDLGVVLPLDAFTVDPDGILGALYASGSTSSDPKDVAEMLGVQPWRLSSGLTAVEDEPPGAQHPQTARVVSSTGGYGITASEPGFMPVSAGDTFETVQLGLCLDGIVKLFSAADTSTWSVGADGTLFEAQCRGSLARTAQVEDSAREAALFNAGTGTLMLQHRRPVEQRSTPDGQQISIEGSVVQLVPCPEPDQANSPDLTTLLQRAVPVAFNERGQLRVESGGWASAAKPFCSVELAVLEDGTNALYLEASPRPTRARWWNKGIRQIDDDTIAMVLRASDFTSDQVGLLLFDAMDWAMSPWDLVFTYRRPAPEVVQP